MGWTYKAAKFYKENGRIDRKKECDNLLNWESDTNKVEVLKSAMKGSVYYAAVGITTKATEKRDVFAYVILTTTSTDDFYNFGYKAIDESCGPYESDCPKSILELLTPIDSQNANEWREACWAKIDANKSGAKSLSK